MKGLFLKDWYMIIKQGKFFLIFNLFYAILAVTSDMELFCLLFNVMLNCMMVKTLMAYEEQNRWSGFCVNLPVTADNVVWEKYIVGFICGMIGNVISFAVILAAELMGKLDESLSLMPLFLLYTAVALFYLALELPVLFKFGVNEGRIWFIMVTALAAAFGAGTGTLILEILEKTAVLSEGMLSLLLAALVVIAVLAVFGSAKLSVRIYEKKEL